MGCLDTFESHLNMFSRPFVISKHRDVNLKDVLAFELTFVPRASAHCVGSLRKYATNDTIVELAIKSDVLPRFPRSKGHSPYHVHRHIVLAVCANMQ